MYNGLVTLAQSGYHPRRGECLAQRNVRRENRKTVGMIPANCWTDHSHLALDAVAPSADHAVIRWIADITQDGSRLLNLSGRSCTLGDGPSRHDLDHQRTLREQARLIRELTADEILDEGDAGPEPVPWAIPSHAVPDPPSTEYRRSSPARIRGSSPRSARSVFSTS